MTRIRKPNEVPTLDEFFEATEDRKLLVTNLKCNIDNYCVDLTEDDSEQFLRMNLIVIRQLLEQEKRK